MFENLCTRVFGDIVSDFEVSEGTSALGVDDALWDSLAVKVSDLVDEVDVLQQDRSVDSDSLGSCLDSNWGSTSDGSYARVALQL